MSKKRYIILGVILAVLAALFVSCQGAASATGDDEELWEPCVPAEAWVELIEHPELSHVIHHDAVTHEETVIDQEAVPEVWANFSPDHQQGPFTGPPVWPQDERGTWHVHDKIPGGHEGDDGVYQRDNPHSGHADWFYRQNAVEEQSHVEVVVDKKAYDETIIDEPAWTERIEHPEVTCDEENPIVVDPVYDAHLYCPPRGLELSIEGVVQDLWVGENEAYSWNIVGSLAGSITFDFTAKDGYVFKNGTQHMTGRVTLPAIRCINPHNPPVHHGPKHHPVTHHQVPTPPAPKEHKTTKVVQLPTVVDAGL